MLRRQPCQLVIQDMNFSRRTSGEEGLALLQQIKALTPALPVVLITAWGSISLAVEGMKAGAVRLRHQAVDQPADAADGADGARPGRDARAPADERAPTRDELDARYDFGDAGRPRPADAAHPAAGRPRRRRPTRRC